MAVSSPRHVRERAGHGVLKVGRDLDNPQTQAPPNPPCNWPRKAETREATREETC